MWNLIFWSIGAIMILFGMSSIVIKPKCRRGAAITSGVCILIAAVLGIGFDSWLLYLAGFLASFVVIAIAGGPYAEANG
jgi:hypothetical protein